MDYTVYTSQPEKHNKVWLKDYTTRTDSRTTQQGLAQGLHISARETQGLAHGLHNKVWPMDYTHNKVWLMDYTSQPEKYNKVWLKDYTTRSGSRTTHL